MVSITVSSVQNKVYLYKKTKNKTKKRIIYFCNKKIEFKNEVDLYLIFKLDGKPFTPSVHQENTSLLN